MISHYKVLKAIKDGAIPEVGTVVHYGKRPVTILKYKPTFDGLSVQIKMDDLYGLKKVVMFTELTTPQGELFRGTN